MPTRSSPANDVGGRRRRPGFTKFRFLFCVVPFNSGNSSLFPFFRQQCLAELQRPRQHQADGTVRTGDRPGPIPATHAAGHPGHGGRAAHLADGRPLPAGDYQLWVEAAREGGGREQLKLALHWPLDSQSELALQGHSELGQVRLRLAAAN